MDRLCVMIYEPSDREKKTLHDVLAAHAIRQNVEVVIQWLKQPVEENAIRDACVEAQIAFINGTDAEAAAGIGRLLYRINPDCRLVYYGNRVPGSIPDTVSYFAALIPGRPVRYLYQPSGENFDEMIREFSETESRQKRFAWENKGMKYRIPYGCIRYFRSDRNYVYLHLTNDTEYSFPGKLANVEKQLPEGLFVRVHQSYLVNRTEIMAVDKQKKTVHLGNGEELYISRARYRETMEACAPDR